MHTNVKLNYETLKYLKNPFSMENNCLYTKLVLRNYDNCYNDV